MAPKYKLIYFDSPAMGEPIRFLFSYGQIEFEDFRVPIHEWANWKSQMPLAQLPVLEIDGKKINQSLAIARYVAKLVKLAGNDELHALEIDSMVENINDLLQKIADYGYEPDEELKEKKRVELFDETLPFMLGKFNDMVSNGYFVRGELSYADVTFAALVEYLNFKLSFDMVEKYPNLQKVRDNVLDIPNIKKWVENRPKYALYNN